MRQITIACLLLLFNCPISNAQHTTFFEPKLATVKEKQSLYNSFKLLDSRADTSLGFVQTGAFNRKANIVIKQSLDAELSTVFNSLIADDAAKGKLALQIRQLNFAEVTGSLSETGYFAFQADMYSEEQNKYRLLGSIDTLFRLRSSIDVTNSLLKTAGDTLTGFIKHYLSKEPIGKTSLSYNDLVNIDSLEKTIIKVYKTATYTDGLYLSYESFKSQTPDNEITVTSPYLYPGNVKVKDNKGKLKDVKLNTSYAVVYNGNPYIITPFGFYPLKKVNDEFVFTGKAKVSISAGTMIASSMFGLVGGLIANGGDDATFYMMIDHKKGTIIKLREIPEIKRTTKQTSDSW